eukprot:391915-Rhodomonas_salina.2
MEGYHAACSRISDPVSVRAGRSSIRSVRIAHLEPYTHNNLQPNAHAHAHAPPLAHPHLLQALHQVLGRLEDQAVPSQIAESRVIAAIAPMRFLQGSQRRFDLAPPDLVGGSTSEHVFTPNSKARLSAGQSVPGMWGSGSRGLGPRGLWSTGWGLRSTVYGLPAGVSGLRSQVSGLGSGVWGLGSGV